MLEQRKEDSKKSTLVIHVFPEDGHDHIDLTDMLSFLRCRYGIIRHACFGQVGNIEKKLRVRPIKIELKSVGDANLILSNAKYLRNNAYYHGVYINKWLSENEPKNIRNLRKKCFEFRCTHPGKKIVVKSGRLMTRNVDRRLGLYNEVVPQATAVSSINTADSEHLSSSPASAKKLFGRKPCGSLAAILAAATAAKFTNHH